MFSSSWQAVTKVTGKWHNCFYCYVSAVESSERYHHSAAFPSEIAYILSHAVGKKS